jgi:hypothetical protein
MTMQSDNIDPHAAEAKERWGLTDAYKQSQERVGKMTQADMDRIKDDTDVLMKKIVAVSEKGPADAEVQALIAKHYNGLRMFYEPNVIMYKGLADMYVDDARFTAYYDAYKPGLALFMRDAMYAFCDAQTSTHAE